RLRHRDLCAAARVRFAGRAQTIGASLRSEPRQGFKNKRASSGDSSSLDSKRNQSRILGNAAVSEIGGRTLESRRGCAGQACARTVWTNKAKEGRSVFSRGASAVGTGRSIPRVVCRRSRRRDR